MGCVTAAAVLVTLSALCSVVHGSLVWTSDVTMVPSAPGRRVHHVIVYRDAPGTVNNRSDPEVLLVGGMVALDTPQDEVMSNQSIFFAYMSTYYAFDGVLWRYLPSAGSWQAVAVDTTCNHLCRVGHQAVLSPADYKTDSPVPDYALRNTVLYVMGGFALNLTIDRFALVDHIGYLSASSTNSSRLDVDLHYDGPDRLRPFAWAARATLNTTTWVLAGGMTFEGCYRSGDGACHDSRDAQMENLDAVWLFQTTSSPTTLLIRRLDAANFPAASFSNIVAFDTSNLYFLGGINFTGPFDSLSFTGFDAQMDHVYHLQLNDAGTTANVTKLPNPSSGPPFGVINVFSCAIPIADNEFVVLSGFGEGMQFRSSVASFNTETHAWRTWATTQSGAAAMTRGYSACFKIQDNIFEYGGQVGSKALESITLFMPNSNEWWELVNTQSPTTRRFAGTATTHMLGYPALITTGGAAAGLYFSDMYLMLDANVSGYHWYFQPTSANMTRRSGHAMSLDGDNIFIHFGLTYDGSSSETILNELYYGNMKVLSCPCPPPRAFVMSATHPTEPVFYVYGGADYRAFGGVIDLSYPMLRDSFWKFDMRTQIWTDLTNYSAGDYPPPSFFGNAEWTMVQGKPVFVMVLGLTTSRPNVEKPVFINTLTISSDVYLWDTRRWTHLQAAQGPASLSQVHLSARWARSMTRLSDQETLVIYGGAITQYNTSTEESEPSNDAFLLWLANTTHYFAQTCNFSNPPARYGHTAFLNSEDRLLLIGGSDLNEQSGLAFELELSCDVGTKQNGSFGHAACALCPIGAYNSVPGASDCTACPNDTTTIFAGSISDRNCSLCVDGRKFCSANGECEVDLTTFERRCKCELGFSGTHCEVPFLKVIAYVCFGLLVLSGSLFCFFRKKIRQARQRDGLRQLLLDEKEQELTVKQQQLEELERALTVQMDELTFVRRIDKEAPGAFGEVWLCRFNDIDVAVKRLKGHLADMDPSLNEEFLNEIKFMRTLRHPNIVYFFGAGVHEEQSFLVLEYMGRGSLTKTLDNESIDLPWSRRIAFARDAAAGMAFLHALSPPRIHRDLKSPNLLISQGWTLKVADFGTAKLASLVSNQEGNFLESNSDAISDMTMTKGVGTLLWTSPETLSGGHYSLPADVYSFAIVMWEIATRKLPWSELTRSWDVAAAVEEGRRPTVPAVPVKAFTDLMQACWDQEPSARPTFAQAEAMLKQISAESDVNSQESFEAEA
ncbi:uncharacterized protein MONBRDRAFT_27170 [Monosiga brevicollis MX1]|uniref:Protein kinase domain-containing protein n=1 Tax=Monosiga brevicollis TaxID=81824 RepID=A9V4I7_MONBE|nr:uncharacterized protein MONBRDRAFT_27170 [Monosiga brevicollis MX1]EDQ87620.1 predicted protein [Monosiga brevicollis MX1]|eukprot:XP_001747540.1 hypothetical protein [Monosiga brevicollis MX1]